MALFKDFLTGWGIQSGQECTLQVLMTSKDRELVSAVFGTWVFGTCSCALTALSGTVLL